MGERRSVAIHPEDVVAMDRVGERLARLLRAGDMVLLFGELGAGKTTLTRSVVRGLGIDASIVSSPTFTIMNVYPNERGPDVYHLDAYRLGSAEDLDTLGWDRIINAGGVILIEWPERVLDGLPAKTWRIEIEHAPIGRRLRVTPPEEGRLAGGDLE